MLLLIYNDCNILHYDEIENKLYSKPFFIKVNGLICKKNERMRQSPN